LVVVGWDVERVRWFHRPPGPRERLGKDVAERPRHRVDALEKHRMPARLETFGERERAASIYPRDVAPPEGASEASLEETSRPRRARPDQPVRAVHAPAHEGRQALPDERDTRARPPT